METKDERSSTVLILIGLFKLFKAAILILIGLSALRLLHGDAADKLVHWARAVRVDPNNRHIHKALATVAGINRRKLEALSAGTFCYAALFLTEGIGLLMRKRWAEYLTVISTAGLLPLEIYEVVVHPRPGRIVILLANIAIVLYLIVRLWQTRKRHVPGPNQSAWPVS